MQEKDKEKYSDTQKKNTESLADRILRDSLPGDLREKKVGTLKALFLVKKADIEDAMLRFSKKRIWEFMNRKGEFPGSYSSFLSMVKKYIEDNEGQVQDETATAVPDTTNAMPRQTVQSEPVQSSTGKSARHFVHNPNSDSDW